MPTLKMLLYVEKTLKTTIQKKSPKSQTFARKYLWRSFVIVKLFLLQFTVILFHSNEQRAKSNEQRAKSNEQQAKSNEQRAKSNEQQAKSSALFTWNYFSAKIVGFFIND